MQGRRGTFSLILFRAGIRVVSYVETSYHLTPLRRCLRMNAPDG
jgi:hypothetical protein